MDRWKNSEWNEVLFYSFLEQGNTHVWRVVQHTHYNGKLQLVIFVTCKFFSICWSDMTWLPDCPSDSDIGHVRTTVSEVNRLQVILVLAYKVCHLYSQTWWPQLEQTGSEWGRCVGEDCFQLVGPSDLHLDPDCTRPVTRQRFWPGQLKWSRGENKWTDELTCIKYCQV